MAIECHERSHKNPAIQNSDPHAVVHVLQHLAAPRHGLGEKEIRGDKRRDEEMKRAGDGAGGGRGGIGRARERDGGSDELKAKATARMPKTDTKATAQAKVTRNQTNGNKRIQLRPRQMQYEGPG